jgi:fructosamine-3-kinase
MKPAPGNNFLLFSFNQIYSCNMNRNNNFDEIVRKVFSEQSEHDSEGEKKVLERDLNKSIPTYSVSGLSGGCINSVYKLDFSSESASWVLKVNSSSAHPGMFAAEAKGLQMLSEYSESLRIPKVLGWGETGEVAFLALEYIEEKIPGPNFWEEFGRGLARLHRNSGNKIFGLDSDNYIGSLSQKNGVMHSWSEFFGEQRLIPMLDLDSRNSRCLNSVDRKKTEQLISRLENLFPKEEASLLHGDLWSGNFLKSKPAALIDPAVYFGSREVDLSMSLLFGGFQSRFYQAYEEEFPLQSGWRDRVELCNLYPLLVHVNLFGASYAGQYRRALEKYL